MVENSPNVYRGCKPVVDAEYDFEMDTSPVDAIIEALAEAADIDPTDLPPLYDFIEPDAINQLFGKHSGASRSNAILSFRVDIWNVYIRGDGNIRICDATQSINPKPVF